MEIEIIGTIFQRFLKPSKCLIAFVGLILGKKVVHGVIGRRWDIDIVYKFYLKVICQGLGYK